MMRVLHSSWAGAPTQRLFEEVRERAVTDVVEERRGERLAGGLGGRVAARRGAHGGHRAGAQ